MVIQLAPLELQESQHARETPFGPVSGRGHGPCLLIAVAFASDQAQEALKQASIASALN
jgi:hypothetical protein